MGSGGDDDDGGDGRVRTCFLYPPFYHAFGRQQQHWHGMLTGIPLLSLFPCSGFGRREEEVTPCCGAEKIMSSASSFFFYPPPHHLPALLLFPHHKAAACGSFSLSSIQNKTHHSQTNQCSMLRQWCLSLWDDDHVPGLLPLPLHA